jgi:hypothetical protein
MNAQMGRLGDALATADHHGCYPRDKPLTLAWELDSPGILEYLPKLSRNRANRARAQIVAELLASPPDQWISYSRRKNFYSRPSKRYRPDTWGYCPVVGAIDQLDVEGLIDHQRMPQYHLGEQSRIRPSERLLDAYRGAKVFHVPRELIVLRDGYGDPVDYRDNRETLRMRKGVITINEMLAGADIRIVGKRFPHENMSRIFNRDFSRGGRFYGGGWQNVPKGERSQITINGDETVEVDYRAMHPRMLYREAGKPLVGPL